MAGGDWKTTVIIFVMAILILKFFSHQEVEHQTFEIGTSHIKYHLNWTNADAELPHVKELQDAYKLQNIKSFDLSLSMSSLSFEKIKTLLPVKFNAYQKLKLNFANNPIGTIGAEYILSLIPNGVQDLEISFDSISSDITIGSLLARRLNNLNSLKKLKLSLIMGIKNETVLDDYLRFGRLSENLQSYSLVLIGNSLTNNSLGYLKTHLSRAHLSELDLNFYANKLGVEGAEIIADALLTQKNLKQLSIDLYFNNITEVGTEAISKSILEVNNPELRSLNYNLDFNYIKNEGGKAVGKTLSQMTNLKSLTIGVASKNFGYLGFKHVVNGIGHLTNLEELSLKCGINRVGPTGAQITRDLIKKLKNLRSLSINFYENYVGDEGLIQLTQALNDLEHLESVYLNYGFNDAKGYGLVRVMELLAKKTFKQLYISFSSNEFQDSEVNLIKDELKILIKKTKNFEFQFMETAISKRKAQQLQQIFAGTSKPRGYNSRINVNSVITEDQEKKYNETADKRAEKLEELRQKDKAPESQSKPKSKSDSKGSQDTTESQERVQKSEL